MTTQSYRLKLVRVNQLKLRSDVRLPAAVEAENFLTSQFQNGILRLGVDFTLLDPTAFSDPANTYVAVLDGVSGSYKLTTLSALISGTTGIEQHITAAGPVDILPNAGIVRVNQTVGAAITLTLPLASVKTCDVLIGDWKGDAGTNNITVNTSGSETFPGGITSFKIDGDTASRFLRRIPGVGYAW